MKLLSLALLISFTACMGNNPITKKTTTEKDMSNSFNNDSLEIATFGAGCFWCVEAFFQELKGVEKVVSGYSGGAIKNPSYKEVCTGRTGHAEVCQVYFDPSIISFESLLEVFWTTHDPNTQNRQGADKGTQYRSAIFFHSEAQQSVAEKSKEKIAPQIWTDPIVTEITPFSNFYPAEDYHQNCYSDNPDYGYGQAVINPKIKKFREKFTPLLK